MTNNCVRVKIKRQDTPNSEPYYQTFEVEKTPFMNVISLLMEIQQNPVDVNGNTVNPVVWECSCLEEVCGSCTMLINHVPRQACSALIKDIGNTILLEPLTKFPVVRDLMVDRSIMFENLKKVNAWIDVDERVNIGPGPRFNELLRRFGYRLARCMTCGCCLEACPQFNKKHNFIGPAALAQVYLFNLHPTGAFNKTERLNAILGEDGIAQCGKAHNCRRVCPKEIPLTEVLYKLNRDALKQFFKNLLDR